jgi:hypothetical protein
MQDNQLRPLNKKGEPHGSYYYYHNGVLQFIDNHINGKQVGYNQFNWTYLGSEKTYYAR